MNDVFLNDLSQQLADLFARREYAAGFALGRHILQSYPRHLQTYKQMGVAALETGLAEDAVDLLQRALSADPEDGKIWAALHKATTQLDLHPDAELAGTYARDLLHPQTDSSIIARGHDAAQKHDWERAYSAYRQGFLAQPQRMDAGLGLATALVHLRQWRLACKTVPYILNELPYSLKALWISIRCSSALKKEQNLIRKRLRTASSLDPDNIYARKWFEDMPWKEIRTTKAKIAAWNAEERWDYVGSLRPPNR